MTIKRLAFSSANSEKLTFEDISGCVILVGPNNSGKSLALAEIYGHAVRSVAVASGRIVAGIEVHEPDVATVSAKFTELRATGFIKEVNSEIQIGSDNTIWRRYSSELLQSILAKKQLEWEEESVAGTINQQNAVLLGALARLQALNPVAMDDVRFPGSNLARIYLQPDLLDKFQNMIRSAFGLYVNIDINHGSYNVAFSKTPAPFPKTHYPEQVEWYQQSTNNIGDGIRSFAGILSEVLAGTKDYLCIDEPEAFLHPRLAFRLGNELGAHVRPERKQLFVSTHSISLVMGILQSGVPTDIFRLTRSDDQTHYKKLTSQSIKRLMSNHPIIKSANVLSGIFYDGVILTEGDVDRVFYSEINERLINADRGGFENGLIVNLNGKDSLHKALGPLRAMGVPTASIVDLDFLGPESKSFSKHLATANVPKKIREYLADLKAKVWAALLEKGAPKKIGIATLAGVQHRQAINLLKDLAEYGIFVLPVGEVEQWLRYAGNVSGDKERWLSEVLHVMGDDPEAADYLTPIDEDVWQFLNDVSKWLRNRERKGMEPNE